MKVCYDIRLDDIDLGNYVGGVFVEWKIKLISFYEDLMLYY